MKETRVQAICASMLAVVASKPKQNQLSDPDYVRDECPLYVYKYWGYSRIKDCADTDYLGDAVGKFREQQLNQTIREMSDQASE